MHFEYSKHCLIQMQLRNISQNEVEQILQVPDKVIKDNTGQAIYQKSIGEKYIYRVFVNDNKNPPLIKTVYKTSKISKYL